MSAVIDASPAAVAQRQLDAYNTGDLRAWLATYAEDAQQFEYPAKLLASGHAQMRERIAARFAEPNLHARLLQRTVLGAIVIDHEIVRRDLPEGPGQVELIAIYEISDGLIRTASFVFGEPQLD
jgi:hypothetical protein